MSSRNFKHFLKLKSFLNLLNLPDLLSDDVLIFSVFSFDVLFIDLPLVSVEHRIQNQNAGNVPENWIECANRVKQVQQVVVFEFLFDWLPTVEAVSDGSAVVITWEDEPHTES